MEENDARYLGPKYFGEVGQYLPKGNVPPLEIKACREAEGPVEIPGWEVL